MAPVSPITRHERQHADLPPPDVLGEDALLEVALAAHPDWGNREWVEPIVEHLHRQVAA